MQEQAQTHDLGMTEIPPALPQAIRIWAGSTFFFLATSATSG